MGMNIEKELTGLFHLGQTYWQQADSRYYSQNKKSYATFEKAKSKMSEVSKFVGDLLAERDELREKLAAMESQGCQPIGYIARHHLEGGIRDMDGTLKYQAIISKTKDNHFDEPVFETPLFVAKQVPSDLEIVQKALGEGEVLSLLGDKIWCVESRDKDNSSGYSIESLLAWAKQRIGVE